MPQDIVVQALKSLGFQGSIEKDFPLSNVVYYRIGGPADYFVCPKGEADIEIALKYFSKQKIPIQIIGGGTNLLVRDAGMRGAVIYLGTGLVGELQVLEENDDEILIRIPAHWAKSQILKIALEKSWAGLEFSAGIPGTLGGAVWMNAGTKWGSYENVIESVKFCHPEKGFYTKLKSELGLKYRGHGEGLLDAFTAIVSVDFRLKKTKDPGASRRLVDEILAYRGQRQPLEFANCGSVFKNPPNSERGAGRLIEAAGLKGKQIGQAMVSLKHANFISNLGKATALDVETLIEFCQSEVEKKFGIRLEREVILLGEKSN